jgi:hypothetical protein
VDVVAVNREFNDGGIRPGPERRRRNRPHRTVRVPREGVKVSTLAWYVLCAIVVIVVLVFAFTDVWPYMHEVIWQHSWKPVCDYGHGRLEFCKP